MGYDPIDVWPFLRFTGATQLTKSAFTARYFKVIPGGYGVRTVPRKEMMPELRQVIASCSLRRTKAEAGLDLPPIWLTTQTVDGDSTQIRELLPFAMMNSGQASRLISEKLTRRTK